MLLEHSSKGSSFFVLNSVPKTYDGFLSLSGLSKGFQHDARHAQQISILAHIELNPHQSWISLLYSVHSQALPHCAYAAQVQATLCLIQGAGLCQHSAGL